MKRVISMLLVVALLCISLCSCGKEEPVDNSIQLTMENYKDYIVVDYMKCSEYGSAKTIYDGISSKLKTITFDGYQEIIFEAAVKGASPNFIYNDVVVTFAFEGTYTAFELTIFDTDDLFFDCPVEVKIDIDTNVAGAGSGVYLFDIVEATGDYGLYTTTDYFEMTAKIVDVKGSVTPIK